MKKLILSAVLLLACTQLVFSQVGKIIPQLGHQDVILFAEVSTDGQWMATGGRDGVILLWDMQTGLHWTLEGHHFVVTGMAFNEDGTLFATCDGRGKIIIWDVVSKTMKTSRTDTDPGVGGLAFLPDGKNLLFSTKKVQRWDYTKDQVETFEMSGFVDISTFLVTPDGKTAIGVSTEMKYLLGSFVDVSKFEFFDIKSKRFVPNTNISKHGEKWSALAMSTSGKQIALANKSTIKVLSYPNGKLIHSLSVDDAPRQMIFSADEKHLLSSFNNGKVIDANLSAKQNELIGGLVEAEPAGGRMAYDPTKNFIIGVDNTDLNYYDLKSKSVFNRFESGAVDIANLALDENGKKLWVLTFNGVVEWDLAALNISNATYSTKNNVDGNFDLAKNQEHTISELPYEYFYDQTRYIPEQDDEISMKYGLDRLNTTNGPYHIELYDVNSDETLAQKSTDKHIISCAITANSKYVFVSTVNELIIYDTPNLNVVKKYDYKVGVPSKLLLSPDSETLLVSKTAESVMYDGGDKPLNFDIDIYNARTLEKTGALVGHYSTVNGLVISSDGGKVFSGSSDGSIRIWDLESQKQIALLHGSSPDHYFITTADGYFNMSKDAIKNMAFGDDQNIYPASVFEAKLNRPDKVAAVIGYTPSSLQTAFAKAHSKRMQRLGIDDSPIDFNALPTLSVNDKDLPKITSDDSFNFKIEASGNGNTLATLQVKVNSIPEFGGSGKDLKGSKSYQKEHEIALSSGVNYIEVTVTNDKGITSMPSIFRVKCDKKTKPDLYLLSIGVSEFVDQSYNLTYAAKDASDLQAFFQTRKADYNEIHLKQFNNIQATKEKILASSTFFDNASVDDEVIIFVASHGLLDDKMDYYLAMTDMVFDNPSFRGLKYEDLEGMFGSTKSRNRLMLIDACHSGEVDKADTELSDKTASASKAGVKSRGFKNVGSKDSNLGLKNSFQLMKEVFADTRSGTGATVISSASGTEFAYESDAWNNGVFTYAVINGLKSKSTDKNRDERISVSELKSFVFKEVSDLTNGKQHPTSRIENIDNDFTVVSLADPTVVQYRPTGRFINEYRYYKEQRKRYIEVSINGVDLDVYFETQIGDVWRKSESPVVHKKIEPNVYRSVSGSTIVVTSDHQLIDKDMYGSSEYDKVYTKME